MLTEKVCNRTCCSVVSDMFEFCKPSCCEMPDRAVSGVAHGNLVLFCVVDEVLDRVETVILRIHGDRGACAVYHHDRLEHGICKTRICSHRFEGCELYRDHRNRGPVCRSVRSCKHTGRSAAAGTVLYGNILKGTFCCVS